MPKGEIYRFCGTLSMDFKTDCLSVSSVAVLVKNVSSCKCKYLLPANLGPLPLLAIHGMDDVFRFQLIVYRSRSPIAQKFLLDDWIKEHKKK